MPPAPRVPATTQRAAPPARGRRDADSRSPDVPQSDPSTDPAPPTKDSPFPARKADTSASPPPPPDDSRTARTPLPDAPAAPPPPPAPEPPAAKAPSNLVVAHKS